MAEALELLAHYGDDARILAGGQSLMPALNMRLSEPRVLIDINGLSTSLGGIQKDGDVVRVGALARHAEVAASAVIRQHVPLLSLAMPHVAHAAIRSRGTFGGSLANADPAAELPACALALNATLRIASLQGERSVKAGDFFKGLYETAVAPDEVLLGADFTVAAPRQRFAFEELARRNGDYAMTGIAAVAQADDGRLSGIRLACFGVADKPVLARAAASVCDGAEHSAALVARAQEALVEDIDPRADPVCSSATRMHLLRVLLGRVLGRLWGVAS